MGAVASLVSSTIGKKVAMATTGVLMITFVVFHTLGNLQVFLGAEQLNAYGEFLQHGTHGAIWVLRAIMVGAVAVHVWAAITLTSRNRSARTTYKQKREWREASYASRFMALGGITILLFLVFHILHFTTGTVTPGFEFVKGDVYHNLTAGLKVVPVYVFYVVANLALAAHLHHGIVSGAKTMGVNTPRWNGMIASTAVLIAAFVAGGNILIATAPLLGLVG